jgi:hypothetical protein
LILIKLSKKINKRKKRLLVHRYKRIININAQNHLNFAASNSTTNYLNQKENAAKNIVFVNPFMMSIVIK